LTVIAKKLSELPQVKGKNGRIVIITAGNEETVIYMPGKKVIFIHAS
jgi:hypothetical protein